ncbi:hypothetical protein MKX01_024799 [Papaver californicum]|nr:hypothetical protein MKX01_024799 [Papaver californicum]
MATTSATLPKVLITTAATASIRSNSRTRNAVQTGGLNSFGGLKAHSSVASIGLPVCTEQSFANFVNSLKSTPQGKKGGALSPTCSVAGEIFNIVLIMNGLTLVGVAVGFVLLRVEAFVEESE